MSEFLEVAEQILLKEKKPMRTRDLWEYGEKHKLFSDKIAGKTPWATMKSKLYQDMRKHGDNSRFLMTGPGLFFLKKLHDHGDDIYKAPPNVPSQPIENVLVINKQHHKIQFQGIDKSWENSLENLIVDRDFEYLERLDAESNDGYKQLLTYGLVTREGKVLSFQRGNFSIVAKFLKGAKCVGFGGHVNSNDFDLFCQGMAGIKNSFVRELKEELKLPPEDIARLESGKGLSTIGVLNDDSSPVGRRHIAVVFQYEVSEASYWDAPLPGEQSVTQLRWEDPHSDNFITSSLEYWSQLCLLHLFPERIKLNSSYYIQSGRKKALSPPHLLCIAGAIGGGKSEACKILEESYGYHIVNSGQVLAKLLHVPPVPETPREAFQTLAAEFISHEGNYEKLARAIWEEVQSLKESRLLIDGIRQPETYQALKKICASNKAALIYVQTAPILSHKFYRARTQKDITMIDYLGLRDAPSEKGVDDLINEANAVIYNWGNRPSYTKTIGRMMKELKISEVKK